MTAPPLKTPRTCTQCGNNGHNARTCTEPGGAAASATGFMLFGVRVTAAESSPSPSLSAFRKSVSMNNLSQYEQQPQDFNGNATDVGASGYASDDAIHASSGCRSRERKRGVPWTVDEHKLFLMGLKRVGKGDWRWISRNFVKTRTPTQVASHAQKYFLRRSNINRRRRRSSLFDITTDTMSSSSIEEQQSLNQDSVSQSKPPAAATKQNGGLMNICSFPKPFKTKIPVPPSSKMANLNLNQSPSSSSASIDGSRDRDPEPFLSLKLSSAPSDEESVSRASSFGGFNSNGDSIISVA